MVKIVDVSKIIFGMVLMSCLLYGGDKLDSLDKKTEEFYNNISKIESNINKTTSTSVKTKKVFLKESINEPKELKEPSNILNIQEDMRRFQKLKISSIYSFNAQNYVVFETEEADGRFTLNDKVLGYVIEKINRVTKTITLSKEDEKNGKYIIDLSPEGVSWKKNH